MTNDVTIARIGRLSGGKERDGLYKILVEKLPEHRFVEKNLLILDTQKIANDLGIKNKQTVYAWTRSDSLPAIRLLSFVNLKGSKLTIEDLTPFLSGR